MLTQRRDVLARPHVFEDDGVGNIVLLLDNVFRSQVSLIVHSLPHCAGSPVSFHSGRYPRYVSRQHDTRARGDCLGGNAACAEQ